MPEQWAASDAANQVPAPPTQTIIISYPLPSFAPTGPDFHITANNTAVPIEHYRDRHVAAFSADGDTLTVSLTPTQFDPQPAYLLFMINDLENLVVLLDPPEENIPSPHDSGVQDVTAPPYAADASGKLLATKAIQSAIDRASQSGGGAVLVPQGLYRVQSLSLKSNVTLYVSGEAVALQGALPARSTHNASPAHSMMNIPRVIYIPDLDSSPKSLMGVIQRIVTRQTHLQRVALCNKTNHI